MSAIHIFLPTLEHSALCNHALETQRLLRAEGHQCEIFAEHIRDDYSSRGFKMHDFGTKIPADPNDILIYQVAIGSHVADFLRERKERLVVDFHNITPASFWEPWEPGVTWGMVWGRSQLGNLARQSIAAIAHSRFSQNELDALHFKNTFDIPLLVDFASFEHRVDADALARLKDAKSNGGADVLFVGWMSPHKCQHDIIKAFKVYKDLYDPLARLHLVGRIGSKTYTTACQKLIDELDLSNSAKICGGVSDGELGAYFSAADVLVSMSEHEGVGVPLLEAMHHRVPIVAYSAAAVPETVGNAGLLLNRKTPALVAAAINRVVSDERVRSALIENGVQRLDRFSLAQVGKETIAALAPLIDARANASTAINSGASAPTTAATN